MYREMCSVISQAHLNYISVYQALHLNVVGRFVCLGDPGSYMSWNLVPGGFNGAGSVFGEKPGKYYCNAWPSRLEVRQLVSVPSP